MNKLRTIGIALVLLALIRGAGFAQNGNDLFQQALIKERTEGNLTEAIKLYETIVQKYRSDRKLAGKALFQMAQDYEKLGNSQARKTYERITREFADQKELASDATRRLAALNIPATAEIGVPRFVAVGDSVGTYASVSPDGRFIGMTEWLTADGDLIVRDLSTAQIKTLQKGTCDGLKNCAFANLPVFSPDGREVAYTWYDQSEIGGRAQLRVISNEAGAKPRVLIRNNELNVWPRAWSPDGKSVLIAIRKPDSTWQIGWASAQDGAIKVVKSLGWRFVEGADIEGKLNGISLSPDGRFIAYSAVPTNPAKPLSDNSPEANERHIYLLAADGSSETELMKSAAKNENPCWMPDGAHIVFTSSLSGTSDLWSLAIRNGRLTGSPELVKKDLGNIRPIGVSRSGSYYYVKNTAGVEQTSIAELLPGGSSRITDTFVGMNPSWSPDGNSIAFTRHRSHGDDNDLVIRSVTTGGEKVYLHEGLRSDPPKWFHDNEEILLSTQLSTRRYSATILNLKSGEFRQLSTPPSFTPISAFSSDDRTIFFASWNPDNGNAVDRILAANLSGSSDRQVFAMADTRFIAFALSPDGRTLAIARKDVRTNREHIGVAAIDGSNYREIGTPFPADNPYNKVVWGSDGRSILFAAYDGYLMRNWHVMRVGTDDGKSQSLGLDVKGLSAFDLSPDGSHIAFSTLAGATNRSELFVIDNFNALLKDPQ